MGEIKLIFIFILFKIIFFVNIIKVWLERETLRKI